MEITTHIANLGKYTSGILTDAVLSFPATKEQVRAALQSIGVDGLRYEEIMLCDCYSSIPGLAGKIGEYASIDEVNYLANQVQALSPVERNMFAAAIQHGEYCDSLQDLINLTFQLDAYTLLPGIASYEAYGRYLVQEMQSITLPPEAIDYFDYAAYGEDTAINENGMLTAQGYITHDGTPFREVYDGKHIPAEYRIFQYPMEVKAKEHRAMAHQPNSPTR